MLIDDFVQNDFLRIELACALVVCVSGGPKQAGGQLGVGLDFFLCI